MGAATVEILLGNGVALMGMLSENSGVPHVLLLQQEATVIISISSTVSQRENQRLPSPAAWITAPCVRAPSVETTVMIR